MKNFWESFSVGIISGLVTSAILLVLSKYWSSIIIPWFEQKVYKDSVIEGNWKVKGIEDGISFEADAKIKQKAHRVNGLIYYKDSEYGLFEYSFTGEIKNTILTAEYWQNDKKCLDRGTFTLLCKKNGTKLTGMFSWYRGEKDQVYSGPYDWERVD